MRSFLRRKLTDLRNCKSGNATLIVALCIPALIGGGGFAIDTAQWYMWKRELQHSVDQAALAGAYALTQSRSEGSYATRAQQEFDANQDKTAGFDSALSLELADYAGGSDNSVIARASASKSLPFSSFLTGEPAIIRVQAQASFAEGGEYDACLVSTAETGVGTSIGNNATVTAECGLAALSCDDEDEIDEDLTDEVDEEGVAYAIEIDDNANVTTDHIYACGSIDVGEDLEGVAEGDLGPVLVDDYADLTPPDNSTPRQNNCSGQGNNKQASLLPGTYQGLTLKCTTVLSKGIYVIDGGTLDLAGNYNVTGNGVMFVLKNGATIKLTGNGGNGNDTAPTNTINLTPMTSADFASLGYTALADRYAGMLIFEHRDNNAGNPGHKFAGNANSVIEGVVYLPDGEITIIGTANVSSECLQISAYRINIAGGAQLETFCPTDDTMSVGSQVAQVRLVA